MINHNSLVSQKHRAGHVVSEAKEEFSAKGMELARRGTEGQPTIRPAFENFPGSEISFSKEDALSASKQLPLNQLSHHRHTQ